jgi:F-type H+-transporting ATPase subunit c
MAGTTSWGRFLSKEFEMTRHLLLLVALLLLASPMFAQTGGGAAAGTTNWVAITAGFSMAIASGLCALAQGKAVAGASEAIARNPGAAAAIRFALLLGLVLIESLALYTLVIIIVKVV